MSISSNFINRFEFRPFIPNDKDVSKEDEAKKLGQAQLEGKFPKTTTDERACCTRYEHVTIDGQEYTVYGKPTYEHNIADGTYTLKSVEYTVEKGRFEMEWGPGLYKNNIVENMPVDGNTNIQDLKDKFADLTKTIAEKTTKLRQLMDKISGNGNEFASLGFEPIDFNSPDATEKLAKQIEDATAFISNLDMQIRKKTEEYHQKTDQCWQLKNQAKSFDKEFDKVKQLWQDLCEHYGIDNSNKLSPYLMMEAPEKQDLDSLISHYKSYISMQKDNITKLNQEIDNIKASNENKAEETNLNETDFNNHEDYLSALDLVAKGLSSQFEKLEKLYNDLCEHYGVPNNFRALEMATNIPKDTESRIKEQEHYIKMQKENIAKINEAIDILVNSDGKETKTKKLTDEELKKLIGKAHEIFLNNKPFTLQQNNYDTQVQDFIDNSLEGQSFDSEEDFQNFCGKYYVDLKVEIASDDGEYITYNVTNANADGASAAVTVKKS